MNKLSTGIFVFDGVEVRDFAGPFEVLSLHCLYNLTVNDRRTLEGLTQIAVAPARVVSANDWNDRTFQIG